jgi:hypothetical protein
MMGSPFSANVAMRGNMLYVSATVTSHGSPRYSSASFVSRDPFLSVLSRHEVCNCRLVQTMSLGEEWRDQQKKRSRRDDQSPNDHEQRIPAS